MYMGHSGDPQSRNASNIRLVHLVNTSFMLALSKVFADCDSCAAAWKTKVPSSSAAIATTATSLVVVIVIVI
jgi:hypothetical protein